jgi:alpha-tubulin suppressor-like RCC1 family protein
VRIHGVISAKVIAAGAFHTCVIRTTGETLCWGDNSFGQLGNDNPNMGSLNPASVVPGLDDATSLGAGFGHTCAARASGDVVCWGWNAASQLGCGTTNSAAFISVFDPNPLRCQ